MRSLDTSVAVDELRGAPNAIRLLDDVLAALAGGQCLVASNILHFPMLDGLEPPYR